jgi:hypothetical protein
MRTDPKALRATLRWAGLFTDEQVSSITTHLQPLLQDNVPIDAARTGVVEGSCRVRPLLSCPPCSEADSDKWCLVGTEIFRFANQCFNPQERRDLCSTRYNFQVWGHPFTSVVTYLKNNQIDVPASLEALYRHLGAK